MNLKLRVNLFKGLPSHVSNGTCKCFSDLTLTASQTPKKSIRDFKRIKKKKNHLSSSFIKCKSCTCLKLAPTK